MKLHQEKGQKENLETQLGEGPAEQKLSQSIQRKEETKMAKHETELKIEGMMCEHCKAHVTKALNKLPGAEAEVNLEAGTAAVHSEEEISDDVFRETIEDAGYELKAISRS